MLVQGFGKLNKLCYADIMRTRAITVTQLNNYILQVFAAEEMLHNIEVIGDIDGISPRGNAVYFSLKDEKSCIPCVCYIPAKLNGIKNGDNVVVRGTVGYWHKAGKLSFTVNHVEKFGIGGLFLAFQQLYEKLKAESLFDNARKRVIPKNVKRVGVVTSRQGAVLHDIINVIQRRNAGVNIVLYPCQVQGNGAEHAIAEGIRYFGEKASNDAAVDVIIVARGGGSREDLACFNTELVTRAIFASKVPVVSAVGHDTDWTLCDFVADLRAPTPSAAAELAVDEVTTRRDRTVQLWRRIKYCCNVKLDNLNNETNQIFDTVKNITCMKLETTTGNTRELGATIEGANPLKILERGYAKLTGVNSIKDVQVGDKLAIKMYNGTIKAAVEEVNEC